ncbi:MAG: LacI family transcriptional regulator [Clostridiales Family XIII bacterium]|jgi:LacI family transcriptional regulator|nr:LacI family transcriptional regulator [Clostridiales Family XIII bacterium]
MANIEDVAKRAGLSIATVSRAINGHKYVSDKTKKKVESVMKELGYFPNSVAQQLRGKSTKLIGVCVHDISNPFFAYLISSIDMALKEKGYRTIILQTHNSEEDENAYVGLILKKQIDGMIIAGSVHINDEMHTLMKEGKLVLCDMHALLPGEKDIVNIDNHAASYNAATYLINQGYKRIAFCIGGKNPEIDQRFSGYRDALSDHNIKFDPSYLYKNVDSLEGGKIWMNDFSMIDKNIRPDAVMTSGDACAVGMLSMAHELDIDVPNDIAIVGFDDQPIAEVTDPPLTTIRQPIREMGWYVGLLLASKLLGEKPPTIPELKTKLIVRQSA